MPILALFFYSSLDNKFQYNELLDNLFLGKLNSVSLFNTFIIV